MRIVGEWFTSDDDVTRPIIYAAVLDSGGRSHRDRFLVDTGADRSVFSADLLHRLGGPRDLPAEGITLQGVGGSAAFVLRDTAIELTRDDGASITIRGRFAAFTDQSALDVSILGRDVTDNFDVIISRRRDEVLLLAPNHRYDVSHA
jgi:hypothetical protein